MLYTELRHNMPPVRGLVSLHNLQGQPFRLADVHRWINYGCLAYGVQKIDILARTVDAGRLQNLLHYAREFQAAVSLRISSEEPAFDLRTLAAEGLQDLLVVLAAPNVGGLQQWLAVALSAGLPVRIQFPPSHAPLEDDPTAWAQSLKEGGVRVVSVLPNDPFAEAVLRESHARQVDWLAALAPALRMKDIEFNLYGVDSGRFAPEDCPSVATLEQYFNDHQQYNRDAYTMAERLVRMHPRVMQAYLQARLTRTASHDSPVDRWMTLFLEKYAIRTQRAVVLLRQLIRGFTGRSRMTTSEDAARRAVSPGDGPPVQPRMRYFDAIDAARLEDWRERERLRDEALAWEREGPANRVHDAADIDFYSAVAVRMPGANQLITLSAGEKRCHIFPWVTVPFMIQCTFGGGLAEGIGFAIGRHIRIMCPMVLPNHRLLLYADPRGRYVLIRDGQPVEPMAIEGRHYVPPRLPSGMHLQLAAWNINERLTVSGVRIWDREGATALDRPSAKYSIIIFCTRFARRLEAVLRCIAHQQGHPLSQIEVLVAYVPGVDAAEDVIDSVRLAWPDLKVLHMPFPAHNLHSKGFAINEMVGQSAGEWIMILDSDTLLPPDFFARLEPATASHDYITPRGRAMLDPAATAKVLLGELQPWDAWDTLVKSAPEFRESENVDNVPVGYCQIMRRSCFDAIRYKEYEHFQAADYEFSDELIKRFGKEHRLDAAVLHLHHGGRQWFGTRKQY